MTDYSVVRVGTDSSGRPIYMTAYMRDWWAGVVKRLGFTPTIVQGAFMARNGGGASASAGYHDQGGCIDIRVWDIGEEKARKVVRECRRSGAAAWLRDKNHGGMDPHVHILLGTDKPLASGAAYQWQQYVRGLDGLSSGGHDYHWRPDPLVTTPPKPPAPKPKPAPKPLPVPDCEDRLTLVLANLWRENPKIGADLKTLAAKGADIIACNEGANFSDELENVPGYQAFGVAGTRLERQNPVLVRDGIEVTGTEHRIMCEAVGSSPARTARVVKYRLYGEDRAHINTHANSHVQEGAADPHELPRVTKYVEHMTNLSTLVRSLQAQGYAMTVSGDLNWNFQTKVLAWYWSPQRVFKRLGMRNQWQHRDATAPSHGKRRIDYIAHDADDLRIWEECLVRGHSDHGWPMVTYRIVKETP